MGNSVFVHMNKNGFELTEGITFVVCFGVMLIVVAFVGILVWCKNECKCTCKQENRTSNNKLQRKISYWHSGLKLMFPHLMETEGESDNPELFIAGRKVEKASQITSYFYLTAMSILIVLWFLVVLVENIIYRETTTCNDINVDDDNYVCFNKKWERVDCQSDQRSKNVFCYLYTISPSAFGIAFSVASLISTLVSVSFRVALFFSDAKCSYVGIILIQVLIVIGSIFSVVILGPLYYRKIWYSFFFFFFMEGHPCVFFICTWITVTTHWSVYSLVFTFKEKGMQRCCIKSGDNIDSVYM